uniref:Uncharacterized protein AlNc14C110G6367 n=1 Tax=Albugo laibachii Nc14 TaxID=890382 RepID=F0WIG7_9STRA|nr:conserved hypothetical protein [Albugo laibachii Nc14]|eukprot:CCA21049.1 conserved hypothetical protein [Albugo laibachii Nc14]
MLWSLLTTARGRVSRFVARHKTFIIASSVSSVCLLAGAYYCHLRFWQSANELTQKWQMEMFRRQQMRFFLKQTCTESLQTVKQFLPQIKKRLYEKFALENVVRKLRDPELRNDKKRRQLLWEEAKNLAFARFFSAILILSLWQLLVFAQLSTIGQDTFINDIENAELQQEKKRTNRGKTHHRFLSEGIQYFLGDGISKITDFVQSQLAKNAFLQSWQVHRMANVKQEEFTHVVHAMSESIQFHRKESVDDPEKLSMWREFLMLDTINRDPTENEGDFFYRLSSLLQNEYFSQALEKTVQYICTHNITEMQSAIYVDDECEPPLAKLIPQVQAQTARLIALYEGDDAMSQEHSQQIMELDTFQAFYETAFYPKEPVAA